MISNTRIVAAANKPLEELVAAGKFRQDLFYRFIFTVEMPSLADRKDDIPDIAFYFFKKDRGINPDVQHLGLDACRKLTTYSWPGNVRELHNVIQRAIAFADESVIRERHIQFDGSYEPAERKKKKLIVVKDRDELPVPVGIVASLPGAWSAADIELIAANHRMKKEVVSGQLSVYIAPNELRYFARVWTPAFSELRNNLTTLHEHGLHHHDYQLDRKT